MSAVYDALEDWLGKLQKKKIDEEKKLAKLKVEYELAEVKYSIANEASLRLPNDKEFREEFYGMYIKDLEDQRKIFASTYGDNRRKILRKIKYLEEIIRSVELSLEEYK